METALETEALPEERTEYFYGDMPQVPLRPGYKLGLLVVAGAMVVLPLIYLGVIVLVVCGMYQWATHAGNWLFPTVKGVHHVYWIMLLVYLAPLLVGGILVLFMLKSFFSRWRFRPLAVALSHEEHPELFRFLGQLCQKMGAPIPSRVDASLQINASAGFRAGFSSFFGNDIMLTFGLPLVAGLNCREFAAVMAHEFGHFTQRTAMRCAYVIETVNGWLYRAAFQRDEFEAELDDATNDSAFGLLIFVVARLMIAITRGVMFVLFVIGHALSSYMSRQMEFHADACALAIAGTEGYLGLRRKLLVLDTCYAQAATQFSNRVAPKLPDDLSSYIAMLASQCAGQVQGKVLEAASKEKTHWFSSHPSDAERTEFALARNEPGIISDTRSATVLFRDFQNLSRTLTEMFYVLRRRGRPIPEDQLLKVEEPGVPESAPDTSAEEALIRSYFGGVGMFLRPLLPDGRMSVGLASAKQEQIRQAKAVLEQPESARLRESLKVLDAKVLQALQAEALARAGVNLNAEYFTLIQIGDYDFQSLLSGLQVEEAELNAAFEPFESAARFRLMTALSLLRTPAIASRVQNTTQLQDETTDLLHICAKLSLAFPNLLSLRKDFTVLQTLLEARTQPGSELLSSVLQETGQRANEQIATLHSSLGAVAYPFPHPKGHITLVDYARAKQYDPDPARMTAIEIQSHLQMLFALYHRLLGRLIEIALLVEQSLEDRAR